METLDRVAEKPWGAICEQCHGSGKNPLGAKCLSCYGFGQVSPDSRNESVPMERTVTMHEKPVLPREPNGRRARDLFSNASLDDQITWVKGRLSDVNNPILSTGQRQAARLQLGHCLEKDREHKLPANVRLEAERVAIDPLPDLPKLRRSRKS